LRHGKEGYDRREVGEATVTDRRYNLLTIFGWCEICGLNIHLNPSEFDAIADQPTFFWRGWTLRHERPTHSKDGVKFIARAVGFDAWVILQDAAIE